MWIINAHPATRSVLVLAMGFACLALSGCGKQGLPSKVLHGSVTCGGETVSTGSVSFVPVSDTAGPTSSARIVDGQYRIEDRGGVPLGKHRVQVEAWKKTGRKVHGTYHGRGDPTMRDEEVRVGPEIYAGVQSPLVVDIKADSDGQFDIVLPGS
jgi:hypothetical protein